MQKENSIKAYGKLAKRRLISGYWENIRKERELYIQNNGEENVDKINNLYSKRLMREIYKQGENEGDVNMYNKVRKILSSDGYICNPISQLIDHRVYDELDEFSKQTYIAKLTDKYNEMRERFEKEKQYNICRNM